MLVLRTPESRFQSLVGFNFLPQYVTLPTCPVQLGSDHEDASLRIHYLDEGPRDATETILLLHGEPSWCYLYRKMIPALALDGHRIIAPDLVGFGKSDKPASRTDYTYARHVDWMNEALFSELDLTGITLVCQDWGGLIGLRLVGEHPERFRRVVAANTGLPTGDSPSSDAFLAWQKFSQEVDQLPVGKIVSGGCTTKLSEGIVAAYDAPFPDESFKEGARQFPALVPTSPDDPASDSNRLAWDSLRQFNRPFLCAFSDSDPITKGADARFIEQIPGARGMNHITIQGGGHFLQEDRGEELAAAVVSFISSTPQE